VGLLVAALLVDTVQRRQEMITCVYVQAVAVEGPKMKYFVVVETPNNSREIYNPSPDLLIAIADRVAVGELRPSTGYPLGFSDDIVDMIFYGKDCGWL
jgi:hypothetical protein